MNTPGVDDSTVLVVYPQALLRQALCALIGELAVGVTILEAANGHDAAAAAAASNPTVVLLGGRMDDGSLAETCGGIRTAARGARLLVMMPVDPLETGLQVLRSGAHGCLVHDAGADELQRALGVIVAGGTYVSPEIADDLALGARGAPGGPVHPTGSPRQLSAREQEVLAMVAQGQGNTAIARKLALSVKTVESHKAHLAAKLGVRGSVGLIKYAIRRGLIDLEPSPVCPVAAQET